MFSRVFMRVALGCFMLAILQCVTLFAGQRSLAAQAQAASGWEIIETCTGGLSYPVTPRSQWTFEGVLFSETRDGIRTIRTDFDTSYFIALDSAETFSSVGAFSPDGKWFAYPVGVTDYVNIISDVYGIDAIEVVSTDPARTVRQFSWQDFSMGSSPESAFLPVFWLDNERLYFTGGRYSVTDGFQRGILNLVSDHIEPWPPEEYPHGLHYLSPDATRAFTRERPADQVLRLMDLNTGTILASLPDEYRRESEWQYDSTSFFTVTSAGDTSTENQLTAFSRDGEPLEVLYSSEDAAFNLSTSPEDNLLAFTAQTHLYVADLVSQQIRDLCFTFDDGDLYRTIIWSPDGRQLAFTYDGYPVLLSLDTLEMEILDYPTGQLVGWYSIQ